ncbi:MAG: diguanylate cyclase [Phycisphaerae bacterium]|nr:diguanylate cyclase [Phycisphaerae bacterium]
MSAKYDVFVAEWCSEERGLLVDTLNGAGFSCRSGEDGTSAWNEITRRPPRIILAAWDLPGLTGPELCRRVREHADLADTFFILMTDEKHGQSRGEALRHGADDYLSKPVNLDELLLRMRVGLRLSTTQENLRRATYTDALTGLFNHDHLNRVIEAEMSRARRYGGPLSFIMIDLDCFKAVNDTYGHLAGNQVLVQVAACLRSTVREVDSISRFGGDEFAIVTPESSLGAASLLAERIRATLSERVRIEGAHDFMLTASIGVSSTDDLRVKTAADLVNLADLAMYIAKRTGRNRVATVLEVPDDQHAPESLIETKEVQSLRRRVAALSAQAKQVYVQSIASLVQALDEKDPYTARHSQNVSLVAERIARALGCSEGAMVAIKNAALLHDIGKVGVPDRILMKPAGLSSLELAVMKQVPLVSARIVDHLRILESERQIIRHQREYYDGSGVPDGLRGTDIPVGSRILLVSDAFDAMTTNRVYRSRRSIDTAIDDLRRCAGTQFDPHVVEGITRLVRTDRGWWENRIRATDADFPLLSAGTRG